MFAARLLAAAALFALLAGCSIQIGGGGCGSWGGGTSGHSSDRSDGRVNYSIGHLTHDSATYLVIVVDGTGGLTAHRGGPPGGGDIGTLDGRTITWQCATDDGQTGTVTIAGSDFPLESGGLFLVSARNGKTWVRQVKCDLSKMSGSPELAALQVAAAHDAAAVEFFKRLETPRPHFEKP